MRITVFSLIASLAAYASAQNAACGTGPNPFCIPQGGYFFIAGQSATVKWTPNTGSTVTLVLRSGASSNLDQGTVIVPNLPNSGSYTWTPSTSITRGSDYTIEIVDTANPSNVNYTPQFKIISDNTVASSTAPVTLVAAPTSSMNLPTVAPSSSMSLPTVAPSSTTAALISSSVLSQVASASSAATTSNMSSVMRSTSMSRSSASSMSSSMAMSSGMSSSMRTTTLGTSTRPTSTTSTGTTAPQLLNTGGAGPLGISGGLLVIALGIAVL